MLVLLTTVDAFLAIKSKLIMAAPNIFAQRASVSVWRLRINQHPALLIKRISGIEDTGEKVFGLK